MANLTQPTNSLVNNILANSTKGAPVPTVGMGATVLMWTDRKAATIIAVRQNRKGEVVEVDIQMDTATRTDSNGMSECQTYTYTPNTNGPVETYTRRRNGSWVRKGESIKGTHIALGRREAYHDYSF